MPGGQPSTMHPTDRQWDSPYLVRKSVNCFMSYCFKQNVRRYPKMRSKSRHGYGGVPTCSYQRVISWFGKFIRESRSDWGDIGACEIDRPDFGAPRSIALKAAPRHSKSTCQGG